MHSAIARRTGLLLDCGTLAAIKSADGLTEFLPPDEWRPYIRAVVAPERRVSTERKTGVYVSQCWNSPSRQGRARMAPAGELTRRRRGAQRARSGGSVSAAHLG
jgi:hypothetical protein